MEKKGSELTHSQHVREQTQRKGLDTLLRHDLVEIAKLLVSLLLGPRTMRNLVDLALDIHEPSILHPALDLIHHTQPLTDHLGSAANVVVPLDQAGHLVDAAVIGAHLVIDVLVLDPAVAGGGVLERPPEELRPVGHAGRQVAHVDQVEGLAGLEAPLGLVVVDDELAVGRHEGGLDWGEVDALDFHVWQLVGDLHGPDAGAGA